MKHYTETAILAAARAAHEANRAWCIANNDIPRAGWDDMLVGQRESIRRGVVGVINGRGSRESHAAWVADKIADGWRYGDVADPTAKTHPCMVPYDDLEPAQKAKDGIFVAVVGSVLAAFDRLAEVAA